MVGGSFPSSFLKTRKQKPAEMEEASSASARAEIPRRQRRTRGGCPELSRNTLPSIVLSRLISAVGCASPERGLLLGFYSFAQPRPFHCLPTR